MKILYGMYRFLFPPLAPLAFLPRPRFRCMTFWDGGGIIDARAVGTFPFSLGTSRRKFTFSVWFSLGISRRKFSFSGGFSLGISRPTLTLTSFCGASGIGLGIAGIGLGIVGIGLEIAGPAEWERPAEWEQRAEWVQWHDGSCKTPNYLK